MREEQIKEIVEELKDMSLAAITSICYQRGVSGIKYFELRKVIFKELQRIDSKKHFKLIDS